MPGRCQVIETESRFKVIRGQGFGDGELLFNRSWVFNLKWYKSPGNGQGWCVYYEWASCSKVIRILSRWYVFSHKRVYPIPEDSLIQFTISKLSIQSSLWTLTMLSPMVWKDMRRVGLERELSACSVSIRTRLENSSTDFNLLGMSTHESNHSAMVCEETGSSGGCWPSA